MDCHLCLQMTQWGDRVSHRLAERLGEEMIVSTGTIYRSPKMSSLVSHQSGPKTAGELPHRYSVRNFSLMVE